MFRLGPAELILMMLIGFFLFSAWKMPEMDSSESSDSPHEQQVPQQTFGVRFFVALSAILVLFAVAELWLWSVS